MGDRKELRYQKRENELLDQQFDQAFRYGKIRLGMDTIFWKKGLAWYHIPFSKVSRIYRRIEGVDSKMCCGNVNFDIQKLILVLHNGEELELLIGDGMLKEAEALYKRLKEQCRGIEFGKKSC